MRFRKIEIILMVWCLSVDYGESQQLTEGEKNLFAVLPMGKDGPLSPKDHPLTINSSCVITDTNDIGTCQTPDDCPSSSDILTFRRVPVCFHVNRNPVLCCPLEEIQATKKNIAGQVFAQSLDPDDPKKKCSPEGVLQKMCKFYHGRPERAKRYTRYLPPPPPKHRLSPTDAFLKLYIIENYFPRSYPPEPEKPRRLDKTVPAKSREYPHMAMLGWINPTTNNLEFNCGGFLVDRRYVVTSGNCIQGGQPHYVRLGGESLGNKSILATDMRVASHIMHPKYVSNQTYNDIALLKLDGCARQEFTPICLWDDDAMPDQPLEAVGYGAKSARPSDDLLKFDIKVREKNVCDKSFRRDSYKIPDSIIESQLCAGNAVELGNIADSCRGDSGGPVIAKMQKTYADEEVPFVMGISSFRVPSCNVAVSVYTRISEYACWLEETVWTNSKDPPCN